MGRSAQPGIDRRRKILKMLRAGSSIDTSSLSRSLGVSEMTIRRDLRFLEDQNSIVRSYGGATLARRINLEFQFDQRRQGNLAAKQAIGRVASRLVTEGETVFIDTGTTTLEFARVLARQGIPITVATSSLAVGSELWGQEHIKVLMLGGQLREGSPDLTGPLCEHSLQLLQASRAFLGCDALSPERGFFARDTEGARVSATMLKYAAWRCILADGNKFEQQAPVRYAGVDEIDLIVTDNSAPSEQLEQLRQSARAIEVVDVNVGAKEAAEC